MRFLHTRKISFPGLDALRGLGGRPPGPPSRIIVGLGNPGSQYAQTRHNVGIWCVERIARGYSIAFSRRHGMALIGEGEAEGHRVVLAKPRTFVNRSGQAVVYLLARYRASPQDLLVIFDDMALEPGRIRLRPGGGAAGHKGLESIIEALGTQEFSRLRVGIGRPSPGLDQIDYVLGTMSEEERKAADDAVELVPQAVLALLTEGITVAMNRFN